MKNLILSWETDDTFLLYKLLVNYEEIKLNASSWATSMDACLKKYRGMKLRVFPHFNVTYSDVFHSSVSSFYREVLESGGEVVNLKLDDISKVKVQSINQDAGLASVTLLDLDGSEYVIVKSNHNYGGRPERFSSNSSEFFIRKSSLPDIFKYRVCPIAEVTPEEMANPDIVVERYINNKKNIIYRAYVFMGKIIISRVRNPDTIKKMQRYYDRKNFTDEVIEKSDDRLLKALYGNVQKFTRSCGLGFGTLDIVMDDLENLYIIDLNITPSWGSESQGDLIDYLRIRA